MDKQIYTIKDIAMILGANESTVRTWKRAGNIPERLFKKIGGTVFVIKPLFDEWLINP